MRSVFFGSLVTLTLAVPCAWSQSVVPVPSACEEQVQEQYRQLGVDRLLAETTAAGWGPQLVAITSQLRVKSNQYELKKNQAELAEQRWLQTNEDLRLERTRHPAPASATPAPTN